jgi:hypothetical protein
MKFGRRELIAIAAATCLGRRAAAARRRRLLFVADELPAMERLAAQIERRVGAIESTLVAQDALPPSLATFDCVFVYIHRDLAAAAEGAFIDYAERGGRLVVLHHSISSHKRKNRRWLPFLGVRLPEGDLGAGGYKTFDDMTFELVNRAPRHPVTSARLKYERTVKIGGKEHPAFVMEQTEVYVNHVLEGPRTILFGLHYAHAKTGQTFDQDTAGWYRRTGRGEAYYFMPGHRATDFENPWYAQVLANVVAAPRGR